MKKNCPKCRGFKIVSFGEMEQFLDNKGLCRACGGTGYEEDEKSTHKEGGDI